MKHVRALTEQEKDSFPDDNSVNVAIHSPDGEWYYGDEYYVEDEDGIHTVANFVRDEDGYLIPLDPRPPHTR